MDLGTSTPLMENSGWAMSPFTISPHKVSACLDYMSELIVMGCCLSKPLRRRKLRPADRHGGL